MSKKGCLIIHGFGGCRQEVEPLGGWLNLLGYEVSMPVLKGHEADAQTLGKARWKDWVACSQAALDRLKESCRKVVVIGFSMGGLVAANLCQNNAVDGIVFINTPVYYWGMGKMLASLYTDFKTNIKKYSRAFRDIPLHAMFQFQLLLNRTKPLFQNIACSSLVLQSIHDDVVVPKSAEYIYSRLKGSKELGKVPRGGHLVLLGDGSGQVCTQVQRFLTRL